MGAYTVLANRYRPRSYDEVVGQAAVGRVLEASLRSGREGHAYLFCGPRGVGKTSMARILAKAFNCLSDGSRGACGDCAVCRAIDGPGDCLDVVEIDGASHNRVENVRDLIENLRFRPVEARFRVYIVDEVHMLSTAAFNALLKTLEEPPEHAKFILATTEPLKVPETIRSRCQVFDFALLSAEQMTGRLEHICGVEGLDPPEGLLQRLARHARGSMRDALVLLDQLITFGDGQPTVEGFERLTGRLDGELLAGLLASALAGDTAAVLSAGARALDGGARPGDLMEQLAEMLSGLLLTVAGAEPADRTEEERAGLSALAEGSNLDQVVAMLDVLTEAGTRLRQRHDPRLVVELALVALARVRLLQPISEALASVSNPGGSPSGPAGAAPAGGGSASAGAPTTPAAGPDFAARFIAEASRGARSVRAELARYRQIRLEQDEVVLVLPPGTTPGLFDPDRPPFRKQLEQAARKAAGREVRLRVEREPSPAHEEGAAGDSEAFRRHMAEGWPGAERVDS